MMMTGAKPETKPGKFEEEPHYGKTRKVDKEGVSSLPRIPDAWNFRNSCYFQLISPSQTSDPPTINILIKIINLTLTAHPPANFELTCSGPKKTQATRTNVCPFFAVSALLS